jgi:hypothetical protein
MEHLWVVWLFSRLGLLLAPNTGIDLKKPIDDLTKHELLAAWH